MSKSARFIVFRALPGKRDEVKCIWERYARDYIADNADILSYCYCYDDKDPNLILVFQLVADEASGQAFLKQPWFADYQRETAPLVASPSEIWNGAPQWFKGDDAHR